MNPADRASQAFGGISGPGSSNSGSTYGGYAGHPDFGISGALNSFGNVVGTANQHAAPTGFESALGGSMRGPDSFFGGPVGGYTGFFGQQYNQNMKQRYGQHQMHDFLKMMSQKYGHKSMKNFVDSYLGQIDSMAPKSYHEQAQELNFAPMGFGPSQGLGYSGDHFGGGR